MTIGRTPIKRIGGTKELNEAAKAAHVSHIGAPTVKQPGKHRSKSCGAGPRKRSIRDQSQGDTSEIEIEFRCPKCKMEACVDVIECDACMQWYHFVCVGLGDKHASMNWENLDWLCPTCLTKDVAKHETKLGQVGGDRGKTVLSRPPSPHENAGANHDKHRLILPHDAVKAFLCKAKSNSLRNVETIGILAGQNQGLDLHVTHLIIPNQVGDTATCECRDEEQITQVLQDSEMVQLGWIHTHPLYDTFLSSVDVHTQYNIQRELRGAVAIVCAVRKEKTGYFRLTEKGLLEVGQCKKVGFHEGCGNKDMWEQVEKPEISFPNVQVVDLRPPDKDQVKAVSQSGTLARTCDQSRPARLDGCLNPPNLPKDVGDRHSAKGHNTVATTHNQSKQHESDSQENQDQVEATQGNGYHRKNEKSENNEPKSHENRKTEEDPQHAAVKVAQAALIKDSVCGSNRETEVTPCGKASTAENTLGTEAHNMSVELIEELGGNNDLGVTEEDNGNIASIDVEPRENGENGTLGQNNKVEEKRQELDHGEAATPENNEEGSGKENKVIEKDTGAPCKQPQGLVKRRRPGLAEQVEKLKEENQKLRTQILEMTSPKNTNLAADKQGEESNNYLAGQPLCRSCAGYLLWLHTKHVEEEGCETPHTLGNAEKVLIETETTLPTRGRDTSNKGVVSTRTGEKISRKNGNSGNQQEEENGLRMHETHFVREVDKSSESRRGYDGHIAARNNGHISFHGINRPMGGPDRIVHPIQSVRRPDRRYLQGTRTIHQMPAGYQQPYPPRRPSYYMSAKWGEHRPEQRHFRSNIRGHYRPNRSGYGRPIIAGQVASAEQRRAEYYPDEGRVRYRANHRTWSEVAGPRNPRQDRQQYQGYNPMRSYASTADHEARHNRYERYVGPHSATAFEPRSRREWNHPKRSDNVGVASYTTGWRQRKTTSETLDNTEEAWDGFPWQGQEVVVHNTKYMNRWEPSTHPTDTRATDLRNQGKNWWWRNGTAGGSKMMNSLENSLPRLTYWY